MCACAERGVAIGDGVKALRGGDVAAARAAAAFVVTSSVTDLRAIAARAAVAAARMRLAR